MCTLSADRRCGPIDRFDVIPVGIQGEGCIVARMVLPLARRTIVAAACRQYRRMEAVDGGAVWRLERKMHVRHRRADIDPEFVREEMVLPLDQGYSERIKRGLVEAPGGLDIPDLQM